MFSLLSLLLFFFFSLVITIIWITLSFSDQRFGLIQWFFFHATSITFLLTRNNLMVYLLHFATKQITRKRRMQKMQKTRMKLYFQLNMEHIKRTTYAMVREEKKGKLDTKEIKCVVFVKV